MWLLYAVGSALFAGLTSILAKCGIRKTDSTVATAIRTIIVLIFAWVMVFVVGSQGTIASIPARSLVFLGLSGLATGVSWLCYFYALQRGPIDKVVPIDKSSTVMTILLAALLLGESVTLTRGIGVVADRRRHVPDDREKGRRPEKRKTAGWWRRSVRPFLRR